MKRGTNTFSGSARIAWVSVCLLMLSLPLIIGPVRAADLSEHQAADIILSALQGDKQRPSVSHFSFETALPASPAAYKHPAGSSATPVLVPYRITVDPVEVRGLQDKPPSYLFSLSDKNSVDPIVGLAKVDRVDVMQLSKLTQNEYRAEFMIGYSVSSLGSILFGRAMQLERPADATLKLQDDGWRLKLLKRF